MKIKQLAFFFIFFSLIVICSCEKNQAPTCTITNPINGEKIQQGETVTISVVAEDSDGKVEEVRFFINDNEIASLSSTPYKYNWDILEDEIGTFTIKATAIDNEGESNTDEIDVNIIVYAPIAEFTADTTEITVGTQIQFTDMSTNYPTSWEWDFGDGGTSTIQNPTYTYSSIGNYTVLLTATNSSGYDTVKKTNYIIVKDLFIDDRDGKTYKTVQIDNQVWMAENLNFKTDSGSWCYDDDLSYALLYGRLYNWEVANNVCPDGWHLPSDSEWKQLEIAIGMSQLEADASGWRGASLGTKLKSTSGWDSDGNGTDEYGFTALPGGYRNEDSVFYKMGQNTYFWSSTPVGNGYARYRSLSSAFWSVNRAYDNEYSGFSVRCVRD